MAQSQHPLVELILHTAQIGGSLVIVSEPGVTLYRDFLNAALQVLGGDVAVVARKAEDLLERRFETQTEDLIVLLPSSKKYLRVLDPVLAGQRVLLGGDSESISLDFVFPEVSHFVWEQILAEVSRQISGLIPVEGIEGQGQTPCLFLDRDDVIIHNIPYNREPSRVVLMDGIVDLINAAHSQGYWVGLVTNQSGLGRGWISWTEYQAVHQQMLRLLAQQGAWLDDCEWSAYIDVSTSIPGRLLAGLRKPRNGMLLKVHQKLRVNWAGSLMVGDSASDLFAAYAAGVRRLYLLKSEKSEVEIQKLDCFTEHPEDFRYTVVQKLVDIQI